MSLVWMLEGPRAGQFVPVTAEEAAELVGTGKAQMANTQAHLIRRPTYTTREMRADTETRQMEPDKPKRKRRGKRAAA